MHPKRSEFSKDSPIHHLKDPIYAESEITVDPYPVLSGQPSEVCIELRNPTPLPQNVTVTFSWANFGIGLPFSPINEPYPVHVPASSTTKQCTAWVPPLSGNVGLQVMLEEQGDPTQYSQRNVDVTEVLEPGVPDVLYFPVHNPLAQIITINLGFIPSLLDWTFQLSHNVLTNMAPYETRLVTLTVTPPAGQPLPPDNTPIVDVEASANATLIGGFRKTFRPPVPLHHLKDPIYADSEITIDPYPVLSGQPSEICIDLRNPTLLPQDATMTFSWANFGIGLPFSPINEPYPVHLPAASSFKQCTHWVPSFSGNAGLQVMLVEQGYLPQYSQRNVDVTELLKPGIPDLLTFPVHNPLTETVTINLGLISYLPDWSFHLSENVLTDVTPGETRVVSITTTPPLGKPLPEDNTPIVDVEADANATLIGGFRKTFRTPVPLHHLKDPIYAESEITVDPYPVLSGQPSEVCIELRNPTPLPQDVTVTFSWANFGIGLPFSPINEPYPVHLPAASAFKQCTHWIPPISGNVGVQVMLEQLGYPTQYSQRNVDVNELLQRDIPELFNFPVHNPLTETITINLGLISYLPDWTYQLSQNSLLNMNPNETRSVTLTVTPPAGQPLPPDNTPLVDVEGYTKGEIIGGFEAIYKVGHRFYSFIPVIKK
jgi:hypothetical protein